MSNVGIANWLYEQKSDWHAADLAGALIGVIWNFMVSGAFVWRLH